MKANKEKLRRELLLARRSMTLEEMHEKSQVITKNFMKSVDWGGIHSVHTYRSVAMWKEPDTAVIVERIKKEHPHITVSYASLDKNSPVPERKFDLIIVPVLGFDKNNHRLGLGGGWYDRFLIAQPESLKVGLAYKNALIKSDFPIGGHDVKLDMIITEGKIYQS